MKESDQRRFQASVDRYIIRGGTPPEPVNDKVLWEAAQNYAMLRMSNLKRCPLSCVTPQV